MTIKKKLPEFIKLCQHFYTGQMQTFKYLTIEINGLIPFSKITAHKKKLLPVSGFNKIFVAGSPLNRPLSKTKILVKAFLGFTQFSPSEHIFLLVFENILSYPLKEENNYLTNMKHKIIFKN